MANLVNPCMFLLVALAVVISSVSTNVIPNEGGKRVVCYYGSWAVYRLGLGKYDVENIDPMICTHLIYGFVGLSADNKLRVMDPYNDEEDNWNRGAFRRFTDLKKINPNLKTLLAIGGWNEGTARYSRMAATFEGRRTFIESTIPWLTQYDFDGLDLDWEYPSVCTDIDCGNPVDKVNFVHLIREMREVYDPRGWLITAAVSAGQFTIDPAYDVPAISSLLDFISVMTYDFHGAWEKFTAHHSPLNSAPYETGNNTLLNSRHAIEYWISKGAPASKLNLGFGSYGRGWLLDDPANNGYYANASQAIPAGPYTATDGFWGYNEICERFNRPNENWVIGRDPDFRVPHAVFGRHWIGYDDVTSIAEKSRWAMMMGLGGVMLWSVETDDFHGLRGEVNALTKTMYRSVIGNVPIPTPGPDPTTTTSGPDPTTTTTTQGPVDPSQPATTAPPFPTTTAAPTPPPAGECTETGQRLGAKCDKVYYVCVWNTNGNHWDHHEFPCNGELSYDPAIAACNWNHVIGC